MRASNVRLSDLKTSWACNLMVDSIEDDEDNYYGDWYSGATVYLKEGAKKVITKLRAREDRLYIKENPVEDCEYCTSQGEDACYCC